MILNVMEITEQHLNAINYLIQGHTGRKTAASIGVTPETVSRWRNDCEFRAVMNQRLHDSHEATQSS